MDGLLDGKNKSVCQFQLRSVKNSCRPTFFQSVKNKYFEDMHLQKLERGTVGQLRIHGLNIIILLRIKGNTY